MSAGRQEFKVLFQKLKQKLFSRRALAKLFLLFFIGGGFFLLHLIFPGIKKLVDKIIIGPRTAISLLTADTSSLSSAKNRINLLILGIGGESHEEVDLTDTIIFISVDKEDADMVMLSLPRDIWIEALKTKVNAVYYYGEEREKGEGFALIKDAVYQILDQPIHYVIVIDFEGFVKAVDLLGGIEVKVDRAFDDYKYPISGKGLDKCGGDPEYKCRYEHLHFDAGLQHMNGERALKFVRSRNAEGEEGTDFARSQRQQKIILALVNKVFSYKVLFNPAKISELKKTFGDHVKFETQFNEEQITAFLSLFLRFVKNKNEIRTITLDYGDEDSPGFLYNPSFHESGQWVLLPRAEDWDEIQKYVEEKIYKRY